MLCGGFVAVLLILANEAAASETLRLSEFVAEVEAENPNVSAAQLRTRAALQRIGPSRALPDPFVAVGVDEVALGRQDEDGMRSYPRPVLRYQVNQTFPLAGKRRARAEVAKASAAVLTDSVEVTRRSYRVAAVQLFLRALYVQHALATNAKLRETPDDVIAAAEARYVTGGAAHHEVLLAQAERAVLRRDELVLQRALAVLHAEMHELRGRPAGDPAPRLVDDGADRRSAPVSFGAALARQPELRVATAAIDAARSRERAAKTAGYPDLSVQLMAMQSLTPDMPSNLGAMVGISVPIFWKRKQAPAIQAAGHETRAAAQDREALRRRLDAEWVAAKTALETELDTIALYDAEVLPALREALESARAGYVTQKVPLLELLSIVRATQTAELEQHAARIDVRLARLRLDELLSMPSVIRLAPASPTLIGGAGMGGAMPAMPGSMRSGTPPPIRMGTGMQPPVLDTGEANEGMGGMR
jgi:cobalt-zinc-cadmium efflux system outer membrane protein